MQILKDILLITPYLLTLLIYMITITIIYFILLLPASMIFIVNDGVGKWMKKEQH